jgi:glycosyltransferase involved in cell wall biosynthesis
MPVYNAGEYLRPAIESILSQTFSDFEFLIVDDGSTDNSVDIIQSYEDPRIRLIRQENQGCYPARNRAIAEARGEFLANMDADDISLPERFEKQVAYLRENPEVVLVGVRALGCDQEDTFRLPQPDAFIYDDDAAAPFAIRHDCTQTSAPFACQAILFRRRLVEKVGPYDARLCYSADVEFVARAACHGLVGCLPDYLYVFRILPAAISGAGALIQREILGILKDVSRRAGLGQGREFTQAEVFRLTKLAGIRLQVHGATNRRKNAYYETRLATLLRVNRRYRDALYHALKAAFQAPENLFVDRKLASVLVKSVLRR